ncbi:MAG: hypothetical protein E7561_04045 [Ruminococcaceae bacterium]|nr:hypothetical protein [Oscillospiraceae bacterium]
MSKGFKNSLFGFKKTDVINYIEQSHKNSSEKEAELLAQIENLKNENSALKDDISALNEEKTRIENIQDEYIKRYNELEKLSEEIGKLYLTAQTNAKEIVEKSLEDKEIIDQELESNIKTIEEMHESLGTVKSEFLSSVNSFSSELDRLFETFNDAKTKLSASVEKN